MFSSFSAGLHIRSRGMEEVTATTDLFILCVLVISYRGERGLPVLSLSPWFDTLEPGPIHNSGRNAVLRLTFHAQPNRQLRHWI